MMEGNRGKKGNKGNQEELGGTGEDRADIEGHCRVPLSSYKLPCLTGRYAHSMVYCSPLPTP